MNEKRRIVGFEWAGEAIPYPPPKPGDDTSAIGPVSDYLKETGLQGRPEGSGIDNRHCLVSMPDPFTFVDSLTTPRSGRTDQDTQPLKFVDPAQTSQY